MPFGSAVRTSFLTLALCAIAVTAQAITWPQQIDGDEGSLTIYQPQPESLEGNRLTARAAISLELKGGGEPTFGAMWFESRLSTDKRQGTVEILEIDVTKVTWPDSKDAGEQRLMQAVQAAFPEQGLSISLERLSASLETAEISRKSLEDLNNDPPDIKFIEEKAVLLVYDGEPRFGDVDGTSYERALNTPFVVVRDKRNSYFLSDGTHWYAASDAMGPWAPTDKPPADLMKMLEEAKRSSEDSAEETPDSEPPKVVAAARPTELIVTAGKPNWIALQGGELLYVDNTETPWLRYLPTGNMYLLLSGRWYRSKSNAGPWTFVPSTELPDAFAKIPPASAIGGLRTSVAGTEEAEEAMLDAAIPQTAPVDRKRATLKVEYDGKPKFEAIPGTKVSYAVNTGAQVLLIDKRYYAADNGVWFESDNPTGPWAVAEKVPEAEIAKIPPSSPVYNLTYVHVFESTPEVVYVGYYPGYLWSFPYYGVPVYGTGWYYPPYWGSFYYPRPPTWGFHVGYNPWTGWNFGVSWTNGFFSLGIAWGGGYGAYRPWGCCGGWYGGGYRGPTFINTGDINIGNNINIGNQTNIGNRLEGSGSRLKDREPANLYQRADSRERLASREATGELRTSRTASQKLNNVYADRDGNIARRLDSGWETRNGSKWNSAKDRAGRSNLGSSSSRDLGSSNFGSSNFNRGDFNRAHNMRSRGARREMRRPRGRFR
ncbi:MAG: carbohydrate-binding family V/XII [Pseudomonadota bacterium]